MTSLLRDFWYVATPANKLKPGQLMAKKMLGEPIVVGRREDGEVFALRDICPHRGIPLHHGWIEGDGVYCCYHGWKFNTSDGVCSEIPSLTEHDRLDISRICVTSYPCREIQGHIWVFIPADSKREINQENTMGISVPHCSQLWPPLGKEIQLALGG